MTTPQLGGGVDSQPAHPGDQVVEVIVITAILYHSSVELVFEIYHLWSVTGAGNM